MRRNVDEAFQHLLDSIENLEEDGNGWNGCCPAHDDKKSSLNIARSEDGTILINCKAGCTVPNICYSVGLTMFELFPEPEPKRSKRRRLGRVVKEYQYIDETGVLRYQVTRHEPKDFRQRRPDGNGGWVWGLFDGYYYASRRGWFKIKKGESPSPEHRHFPACKRILYRLPDLIAADAAKTVYVVEGEKDVDRLWELGAVATCNVGGAGKWSKSYSQVLVNRTVIVIADNDEAGRKHLKKVAESLHGIASSVKTVELPDLPEHGDVSDWLDSGRTFQEIEQIAAQTSVWKSEGHQQPEPQKAEITPEICNGIKDGDEVSPVCMEQIIAGIDQITDGWPRKAGGALFTCNEKNQIQWLHKTSDFYAYMGQFGPPPRFHRSAGCHTKEEVMSGWKWHCQSYRAIESLPHEPLLADHFYAHNPIEPGDGKTLDHLLDRFSPATEFDRDLIKAMFATPLWGGRGGARPAFVITSDAGRGSGKSTIISLLSHTYGGLIDLSPREDIGVLKQRLLSTEALPLRVAVLDNLKSLRFSWGELESLITSPTISGKRLYVGEDSRPNTLTYIITLNGVSLSTDMAQRSVIIKLNRPKHAGAWESETREFIDEHRTELLGDLIAFLRQDREEVLDSYSRWSAWEHAILERLPYPGMTQGLILDRQKESDVEQEETEMIEEFVREKLEALPPHNLYGPYDCEQDRIFIPSKILAKWYCEVSHKQESEVSTIRLVKQRVKAGDFQCIQEDKGRHFGRGFLWVGAKAEEARANPIKGDVESRIESGKFF